MIQEKPNSVDIYVGNRVRLRRRQLQYSQQFLASKLGLTFQQLQKYEKASNH
ncbi:MAG: helix-turn-helix domain-containing protein [Alphaproteobacteria bacterium]|nr:helix-turn-helix domain-containing protein [Alphaproteobacteria bacterium]